MTWTTLNYSIVQAASAVMLLLFSVEVVVRTAAITWQEVQKAWRSLRGGEE